MFLDGHDPNDAEQVKTIKELREQIATKETEYRAALEAEPEPEKRIDEGEQNELRSMLKKTSLSRSSSMTLWATVRPTTGS